MKQGFSVLLAILVIGTSCTKENQENISPTQQMLSSKLVGSSEGDIVPGTLLIKLEEDDAVKAALSEEFTDASIRPLFPIRPEKMQIARKYGLNQWFSINFDKDCDPRIIAEKVATSSAVKSIQYSRYLEHVGIDEAYPIEEFSMTKTESTEDLPFNDTYLSYQWNLINDGSIHPKAIPGGDVGVKDAWRLCAGDPSVVVAILDLGVNNIHEDLRDAVWINEKEIKGNGIDDDGNGFIDDYNGFNFFSCRTLEDGTVKSMYNIDWSKGSGHGTHVAGIIGAVNGNGKGVSSIAGGSGNNDGVRLMSCQTFYGNESSKAADSDLAMAFIYAADNGACIAQCSWGHTETMKDDKEYIDHSPLEYAALQYFLDPANSNHPSLKGNIAVFVAGNQGSPYSIYPGAFNDVLSVTALDCRYLPGGYTNYGPGCKIAAPGGEWLGVTDDYSTMILSTGKGSQHAGTPGISNMNHQYVFMYGTSMACPHVSGVLALGVSYAHKLGKTFTRDEMTSLLLTSVNDIDCMMVGTKDFHTTSSSSTDIQLDKYKGQMGTGAVDAWKFLMAIEGTPTVIIKAGEEVKIDLSEYCNPTLKYSLTIDEASRNSLGLTSDPEIVDGHLKLTASKVGSGKVLLDSSVGKDPEMEDGIGGMNYSREISIVSRPFAADNGGWF